MKSIPESTRCSRMAFTLIELLVTLAIIGTLIALLLPAIQSAREAARLSECKNNLRQLGIAMQNYESAQGTLPPGYRYMPGPEGNALGHAWGAHLLPYVEEMTAFAWASFDRPVYHEDIQPLRELQINLFLCPSDYVSPGNFITMGTERFAMGCYVANFGPPDLDAEQESRLGVFSRNSQTKLSQITDGLSHTLMIGERQNGPFRSGIELNNHFEYETTWFAAVRDIDDPTDDHGHMVLFQTGHTPNAPMSDDRDVSSAHQDLAQFLWCDGSIRAMITEVDHNIYSAAGTRAGEEVRAL